MSAERSQGRIISIDEGLVKSQLGEVVRETVEQWLQPSSRTGRGLRHRGIDDHWRSW